MAKGCTALFMLLAAAQYMFVKASDCPCQDQTLCQRITGESPAQEVFVFAVDPDAYPNYDWNYITTVALFTGTPYNLSIVCEAHAKGARVVFGAPSFPLDQLANATARSDFITNVLNTMNDNYFDGVNVDIEDPILAYSPEVELLTLLMEELRSEMDDVFPGSQLSFDVAWSPDCIDGRCYDWIGLSEFTDFLVVMGYDLRSQIFGTCVASANSPVNLIYEGVFEFINNYGIAPENLVLGVPWYGYDYTCTNSNSTTQEVCDIAYVPFRGVNCSDAAGTQQSIDWISVMMQKSTTGRMWNDEFQSPWYNYVDQNDAIHQVWYDDPESLEVKYELAKKLGLRGISFWNADDPYYGSDPQRRQVTQAMWDALQVFFD